MPSTVNQLVERLEAHAREHGAQGSLYGAHDLPHLAVLAAHFKYGTAAIKGWAARFEQLTWNPGPEFDKALRLVSRNVSDAAPGYSLGVLWSALERDQGYDASAEVDVDALERAIDAQLEDEDRNARIVRLRAEGMSIRNIAAEVDLSPTQVHHVIHSHKE